MGLKGYPKETRKTHYLSICCNLLDHIHVYMYILDAGNAALQKIFTHHKKRAIKNPLAVLKQIIKCIASPAHTQNP